MSLLNTVAGGGVESVSVQLGEPARTMLELSRWESKAVQTIVVAEAEQVDKYGTHI